jgi:hypothetical protein
MRIDPSAPTLTVITPSYNHAKYIRQTIESVFDQGYPSVEHIVVDGGSADGTVEILKEFAARYPGRFRWISEPDQGQSDAFNKGLALARGAVIGWQNSDDYYLANAFAPSLDYLRHHAEVAVVYGDCRLVDEVGKVVDESLVGPFDLGRLLHACFVPNQTAFIRRDALVAVGGLDRDLHSVMDLDLFLKLALTQGFHYLPGHRAAYRLLSTAKISKGRLSGRLETIGVVERTLTNPLLPPQVTEQGRQALLFHVHDALIFSLAEHELPTAERLLRRTIEVDPAFLAWRALCARILRRRVMTTGWHGILDHSETTTIPGDLLTLLRKIGAVESTAVNRTIALALLFRALDAPSRRVAYSYLILALRRDWKLTRSPESLVALARLLIGNAAVDNLNPVFTAARSARHALASGRGYGAAFGAAARTLGGLRR